MDSENNQFEHYKSDFIIKTRNRFKYGYIKFNSYYSKYFIYHALYFNQIK